MPPETASDIEYGFGAHVAFGDAEGQSSPVIEPVAVLARGVGGERALLRKLPAPNGIGGDPTKPLCKARHLKIGARTGTLEEDVAHESEERLAHFAEQRLADFAPVAHRTTGAADSDTASALAAAGRWRKSAASFSASVSAQWRSRARRRAPSPI